MTNGTKTTVTLKFVRDTKGAVLYQEVDSNGAEVKTNNPDCVSGSLYIRKLALQKHFGAEIPRTITMELTAQ